LQHFKLNNDDVEASFFENTSMIGITTTLKDYKLCWLLNNYLGLQFARSLREDFKLVKKGRTYFFSLFEYKNEYTHTEHYLYCNKYDGESLLPELKQMDFLWLLRNVNSTSDYIKELNNIPQVQIAAAVRTEMINERLKLIV
jgi:hypothetical protein